MFAKHLRTISRRTASQKAFAPAAAPARSLSTMASLRSLDRAPSTSPSMVTSFARGFAVKKKEAESTFMAVADYADMRNIAIIAHVDHGKTTLVDALFTTAAGIKTSGERLMDSNAIEQERGITILSKCTAVKWTNPKTDKTYHINIVDTPGHADFGGEVERIMSMVDGVCLVVDATEGPMTQTKFVLGKALQRGLKPLVVVNKVDRDSQRTGEVETEIFDLFANLDANDEQLDFPIVYASGKNQWATEDVDVGVKGEGVNMDPLFELVVAHVPAPEVHLDKPFAMLTTQIFTDPFFGKFLLGRIASGGVKIGDQLKAVDMHGEVVETAKVSKIVTFNGLDQVHVTECFGGNIAAVAGFKNSTVGHTLCHPDVEKGFEAVPIDPPTVCMTFAPNDSPLLGTEGNAATAMMIHDWLKKEAETNVSIKLKKSVARPDDPFSMPDGVQVFGRGELQLGILIENMRRDGFELSVGPPQVVFKKDEEGELMEPVEEVTLECATEWASIVIEKLVSDRKAEMQDMVNLGAVTKMMFLVPTRGLMGYRNEFLNDTRGTGVINYIFHGHIPYKGLIAKGSEKKGAIISMDSGKATEYALGLLQARGTFTIGAGAQVYSGMVFGESTKELNIEANPTKTKHLSNVRASGKDEKSGVRPPVQKCLEEYIAEIRDDEIIEVTPLSFRLRKRLLEESARRKHAKAKKQLIFG